ncbi:MAG: cytochrome P450 [Minwuia sp.]|uniref:cytochrome P450 n=1 Tax=Minwuia sp. TaxID=2493630 RepID=UPI003A86440E
MSGKEPVGDWATDFDILDDSYVKDPAPVWRDLRGRCPIAHTDRRASSWLPTRYADMQALVKMVPELSSKQPGVIPPPPGKEELTDYNALEAPPITSDPPDQIAYRRLILPFFTPKAVAERRPFVETLCHELIDRFADRGHADAAVEYAQEIPSRTIGHMLGIDPSRNDEFLGWVRGVLEIGQRDLDSLKRNRRAIRDFFRELVHERRQNPGENDLISQLLEKDFDGEPLSDKVLVGICNLLFVAGIDTTWSSIGAALLHFAGHPEDRRRMAAEPELWPTAIEELLRFYSPVTMARVAQEEVTHDGITFQKGDRILLSFPAANRDPDIFERADEVVLDREKNRHIAFGIGIHRCAGSNLARMEMEVALKAWFDRIPEFELTDPDAVTWAGGQVRGPRNIPVAFPV